MSKKKGVVELAKDFGKVLLLIAGALLAMVIFTNVYAAIVK